jgi:DNA-binding IclR family transcriptional regulator
MKSRESHRPTERVLDILEFIAQDDSSSFSLADIANALDAPKSSLFPLVHTLVRREYLNCNKDTLRYSIGFKAFEIGMKYSYHTGIYDEILSEMQNIVKLCSESCNFAELRGGDALCIMKVDSPEAIRMASAPGKRLPAYSTALGKILLADKSREELNELYADGMIAVTENTITNPDVLMGQLAEIRKTDIAMECGENALMICCIAVPIKNAGITEAALSVAVPTFRYSDEKRDLIIKLLSDARTRIEMLLKGKMYKLI